MTLPILWPTFAMVALIFVVWFVMYVQRIALMKRSPPLPETFATTVSAMRYFQPIEMSANNFRNLFEMPVLLFALVPLLLITHHAGHAQVALAWAYVGLRAIHSYIHVATRRVTPRFMVYLASCVVLAAMWIGFAVDMAGAATS